MSVSTLVTVLTPPGWDFVIPQDALSAGFGTGSPSSVCVCACVCVCVFQLIPLESICLACSHTHILNATPRRLWPRMAPGGGANAGRTRHLGVSIRRQLGVWILRRRGTGDEDTSIHTGYWGGKGTGDGRLKPWGA